MAKIIPITEHYQHFLAEMKETCWGDLYGHTKLALKRALEAESEWERDPFAAREFYQRRAHRRQPYRDGYYERDFVTRLGTIRLRITRTRGKSFRHPWKYLAPIQKSAWSRKTFEYGTWGGEFRAEFAPQPGDIVAHEHWCSSGFANTDLDLQLKRYGIQEAHCRRSYRAHMRRINRAFRR
jgi:hypothetical protein